MNRQNKIRSGIKCCVIGECSNCPYDKDESGQTVGVNICKATLLDDFDLLVSDMENTIKLLEAET